MDFFEAQEKARRNTWKLILLYLTAVVLIVLSVYLVTAVILGYTMQTVQGYSVWDQFWHPGLFLTVSVSILLLITAGSAFRVMQLRSGGSAVAEMLGGRKIEPSTRDQLERRLINVVEEMSIASGIPVPDVYVLDREQGINAFAAGFGMSDAAVGITRGALERLDRDELQGVIAHEFSHIFNGDMKLNIRLIGILNGILVLHIMGLILMRSGAWGSLSGGGRSRGGGQGGGGSAMAAIMILGLSLLAIGYIGMLFGRMIQAAISRQREYLADAAAVQYTRNPEGLSGALQKIADRKDGGKILDGHAMEMSHLFFASGFRTVFDRMFATHPPIDKRIEAIDPGRDSDREPRREKIRKRMEKSRVSAEKTGSKSGGGLFGGHDALTPEVILGTIGILGREQVVRAGKLLEDIPEPLREAAHEPHDAEALMYALLVASAGDEVLPESVFREMPASMAERTDQLLTLLKGARREWYLPLAELALPVLRSMSREQYSEFRAAAEKLIRFQSSDGLFAFALERMLIRRLDSRFDDKAAPEIRHHHLRTLGGEVAILLSALAYESESDPESAFRAALKPIEPSLPEGVRLLPREECGVDSLSRALDQFAVSANPVKKYFLMAAAHCVAQDGNVSPGEQELIRAISDALECPMPLRA
ncbi:MAG: M48 family metallopeptidase [Balneolaceae bacterium]